MSEALAQALQNQAPAMPPHGMKGMIVAQPIVPLWLEIVLGFILALIIVGLLSLLLMRFLKRQKRKVEETKAKDPWESLLEEIQRLQLPDPFVGKAREDYFFQLGMACRQWLEIVFHIDATDRTLNELKPALLKLGLPDGEKDAVVRFLQKGDLVKFAGAEASTEEGSAAKEQLKFWLNKWPLRSINRLVDTP